MLPSDQIETCFKAVYLTTVLSLFPSKSFLTIFVNYKLGTNESKSEISLNFE